MTDKADEAEADEADEADDANEANKAKATEADEADLANKLDETNEAEAIEADEAETAADDADKAIVTDNAINAKSNEANEAIEADEVNEIVEADEAICGSEMITTTMKPKNPVDETVDLANTTNKLDEVAVAEGQAEGHVVAKGHVISVDCVDDGFLYSLMKYSAILAEVKGYFGIIGLNNQLVGKVQGCSHSLRT